MGYIVNSLVDINSVKLKDFWFEKIKNDKKYKSITALVKNIKVSSESPCIYSFWEELQICNLRHGVIERGEGARHHGDVHHVPEVPHVGSGVKNKTLVKNLKELFFFNEAVSATLAPAGRCECL